MSATRLPVRRHYTICPQHVIWATKKKFYLSTSIPFHCWSLTYQYPNQVAPTITVLTSARYLTRITTLVLRASIIALIQDQCCATYCSWYWTFSVQLELRITSSGEEGLYSPWHLWGAVLMELLITCKPTVYTRDVGGYLPHPWRNL